MTTFGVPPENPTDYLGPTKALTPQIKAPRAPLTTDKNHPIGARWWDTANDEWYWLSHFSSGDAIWKKMTATSSSSPLVTLTTDDATVVNPVSNNIDIAGNSAQGVSTSGAGDTVTITVADATDSTKGVASFDSGDFVVTSGNVALAGGAATQTFTGDSGTATPVAGETILAGGTGITTSAAGQTVTFNLDSPVLVANGGTGATTLTDGGILLGSGTGAVTVTAQPTNGQVLVGSTGVDPVLATLTEGEGIDITNGAGSITIATELATAAATVGAANIGAAAFDSTDFDVTAGFVSLVTPTSGDLITDFDKHPTYWTDFSENYVDTLEFGNGFRSLSSAARNSSLSTKDHPGVVEVTASSSAGNARGIYLGTGFYVGGGAISMVVWVKYAAVSTSGSFRFGLLNDPVKTNITDGVYFEVTNYASSAELIGITEASSTEEQLSTSVDLTTDWVKLEIQVNAAGTEAEFFVDGVSKGTNSTTMPSNTTTLIFYFLTEGPAALQLLHADYIEYSQLLSGERFTT